MSRSAQVAELTALVMAFVLLKTICSVSGPYSTAEDSSSRQVESAWLLPYRSTTTFPSLYTHRAVPLQPRAVVRLEGLTHALVPGGDGPAHGVAIRTEREGDARVPPQLR